MEGYIINYINSASLSCRINYDDFNDRDNSFHLFVHFLNIINFYQKNLKLKKN